MYSLKPDYEQTRVRMDAFWEHGIIDRPVVQFSLQKPADEQVPLPVSSHKTSAERWMDADFQADLALAELSNREYLGDNLPVAWPNLGPDVFAAFYGCPLVFGDYGTSWSKPILHDWSEAENIQLDWESLYLKKLSEMTDTLLKVGRGKFIVGMSDWHMGGDCLAALRDPLNLAIDLIENPVHVKRVLGQIEGDFQAVFDFFYKKLQKAGQPCTTWVNLVCDGKFYLPSNDFSAMVSPKMFEEFFLPDIIEECRFLDRSMYHLDGPGALSHLDPVLAIPELDCLQFVPTPRDAAFSKWAWIYRHVQEAGKCVQVTCEWSEIDQVIETLDPEGVYLTVSEVPSRASAVDMINRLKKWRKRIF